jgi:hypothetical protein
MTRAPSVAVVHVVAPTRSGLFSALHAGLADLAEVRYWGQVPRRSGVAVTDILVMDMDEGNGMFSPSRVELLLKKVSLWVIVGDRPLDPEWRAIASRVHAQIIHCDAKARSEGFAFVVMALQHKLQGPTGGQLAHLVLEREPFLKSAEGLVEILFEHPLEIQKPRDLARFAGTTPAKLNELFWRLGFTRVEHFMACVRMVAFEQLVHVERLPLAVAQRRVGVGSPTGLRRILERAKKQSADAVSKLRTLAS